MSVDTAITRIQAIETKIATQAILKELKDLNEPTHAEYLSTSEALLKTSTKEQLLSMQEDMKIKILHAKDLKILRPATLEQLPHLEDEPTLHMKKAIQPTTEPDKGPDTPSMGEL